nr:50S ribosomal protein L24P [uncultured archaeon]
MKKFSKHWSGSIKPKKQRKYSANLPMHLRKKLVSVNLSKELRKKHGRRNVPARKGDTVRIMRGKFKKKQGKITEIKLKTGKIIIEGIQIKKQSGEKANVPMKASKIQIIELDLGDKKRLKSQIGKENKQMKKHEGKKEDAP